MAERDTLLDTLPPGVRDEAEKLYTDKASVDPRDVVAELHRQGKIDNKTLRSTILELEAELEIRRVKESPPPDPSPTVLGPLGEGAMGEVLIARDEGLNRVVALKRLHPEQSGNRALMRRFYTEAQVTAQLDHPSIVPIHGLHLEEGGGLSYAMKLVRGITLEDYLEEALAQEKAGRPDREHNLRARLERFLHVCDAIAYAHEKGVLHRDLKPENIMVGAFGEVLVMDWGIAKLLAGHEVELIDESLNQSRKATQTKVGRLIGTPRYMSPEQATGKNDTIDSRSDQYALGLILQEMVTFTPACPHKITLEQALARAARAARQPMTASAGAKPARELVAIVDKACALDPAQRYADVRDMAEDIRRYLRDEAVTARPDSVLQRLGRFVSRHRTGVLLLIVSLFTMLVITSGALLFAGLGAHEWRRYQNAVREDRMREVMADTLSVAHGIDDDLRHFEALTTGLSFAAERALAPVSEDKLPDNYDMRAAPPGRRSSSFYGTDISLERPSVGHTGGTTLNETQRIELVRLIILGPQLGRVLVDSPGRTNEKLHRSARHKRVEGGVPVRWVRVGTQSGVVATAPGIKAMSRIKSLQSEDWYNAPRGGREAVWGKPHTDSVLGGLVVTVSHPLFDPRGEHHGTASADVSLDHVIMRMAPPAGAKAWLLYVGDERDDAGRGQVMATKSMVEAKEFSPPKFPSSVVWDKIKEGGQDGWHEVGDQVFSWSHLGAVPWVYVVQQTF